MAERAGPLISPDAPTHVRVTLSWKRRCGGSSRRTLVLLMEANPTPGGVVQLDLSDVVFIDSTGVAMLQQAGVQLDALGCQLVLTNPSRAVRRVLTILGLLEYFSVDN